MKNKVTMLYWGLIIVAVLWAVFATRQAVRNGNLYESQVKLDAIKADSFANNLKVWKDKYNKEHTTVEQHRIEKEVFNRYADSTAKILNVKGKQIEGLTQINTALNLKIKGFKKDTSYVYVPQYDSTGKVIDSTPVAKQINFNWSHDPWISIKGTVGAVDSLEVKGADSLVIADYWKRSWLLGPKSFYTDVANRNPYIKVTGTRAVKPVVVEPKFLLAPSIQVGWYGMPIITPGISFIYYPLSIKIK